MSQTVRVRLVVCNVLVTGNRTFKQALDATGRTQHVSDAVVASIPNCSEGYDVREVSFVKFDKYVLAGELHKAVENLGLDLELDDNFYTLAAINEADPTFADKYPNGTQKINENGDLVFMYFHNRGGECYVSVYRGDSGWVDFWWLPCRRKKVL